MAMRAFGLTVVLLSAAACAPMEDSGAAPVADVGAARCMASEMQDWIGRNRSELPAQPAGQTWRVVCSTCPVTMDYNAHRTNIIYDEATGVIREVKCG